MCWWLVKQVKWAQLLHEAMNGQAMNWLGMRVKKKKSSAKWHYDFLLLSTASKRPFQGQGETVLSTAKGSARRAQGVSAARRQSRRAQGASAAIIVFEKGTLVPTVYSLCFSKVGRCRLLVRTSGAAHQTPQGTTTALLPPLHSRNGFS
jgi:hypothetical protein